jgi:hypothetical protein
VAGQDFVIYSGSTGGSDTTNPSAGYTLPANGGVAGKCNTMNFTVTVPASLTAGSSYNIIAAARQDYVSCSTSNQDKSAFVGFSTTPPTPDFSLVKHADGNSGVANGLVLFTIDYSFQNSNNFVINDVIPANCTLLQQSTGGTNTGTTAGSTLTWNIGNSVGLKTGTVWFLCRIASSVTAGTTINNTATGSTTESGTKSSNPVTTTIGAGFSLIKSQNSGTASVGDQVTYVLNWGVSGESLQWYDHYDNWASGNPIGFDGTAYNPTGGTWTSTSDPTGGKYITANGGGGYPLALRSSSIGYCSDYMVEGDLQVDVSQTGAQGQDAHMVIWQDGNTTSTGHSYMIGISADPGPAKFFIQKNNAATVQFGGSNLPGTGGFDNSPNILQGAWYTVKALVTLSGANIHIQAKVWARGSVEPAAWNLDWIDTTSMSCSSASNYVGWQADNGIDEYDNLKVYGPNPATNTRLYDTVPAGLSYVSCTNGCVAPGGAHGNMVWWDFPGVIYNQTGSYTWIATINDCATKVNQASMDSDEVGPPTSSNSVSLAISGSSCGTPTATPTASPTATPTSTRTATPSATPSVTPSDTRTATPTATPTATQTVTMTATPTSTVTLTATPTATQTVTLTPSPTRTPTLTATQTNTPGPSPTNSDTLTATPTMTATFTMTVTYTATPTATPSDTRTSTPTATPSITVTVPYTSTNTPTASPTFTATPSYTSSDTVTASPTATPTFTQSVTFTDTGTATATLTATPTSTQSVTFTDSYTQTATLTASPTQTVTATRTMTMTFTNSPTITETPVPSPHHMRIAAYNAAGELVRLIFEGSAQYIPSDFGLSRDVIPGGPQNGGVTITVQGFLFDPTLGQLSSVTWLADNNDGQAVSGGIYTIKMETTDQFGQTSTLQKSIQIVSVTPLNEIAIFNSAGELVARPTLPVDPSGKAYTNIQLVGGDSYVPEYDPVTGLPVNGNYMQFQLTDEAGVTLTAQWDGKNAQGIPVNSGSYTAELLYSASGAVANTVVASKGFVVIRSSTPGDLGSVMAGPNPSMRGEDLQIRYNPSPGYRAIARLFNLAGELVKQAEDPNATGSMTIGTTGTAPGVYILKVENTNGAAVVNRAVRKIAIVR